MSNHHHDLSSEFSHLVATSPTPHHLLPTVCCRIFLYSVLRAFIFLCFWIPFFASTSMACCVAGWLEPYVLLSLFSCCCSFSSSFLLLYFLPVSCTFPCFCLATDVLDRQRITALQLIKCSIYKSNTPENNIPQESLDNALQHVFSVRSKQGHRSPQLFSKKPYTHRDILLLYLTLLKARQRAEIKEVSIWQSGYPKRIWGTLGSNNC